MSDGENFQLDDVVRRPSFQQLPLDRKNEFLMKHVKEFSDADPKARMDLLSAIHYPEQTPMPSAPARFWEGIKSVIPEAPKDLPDLLLQTMPGAVAAQTVLGMTRGMESERKAGTEEARKSIEHPVEYGIKSGGIPSSLGHFVASTLPPVAPIAGLAAQQAEKGGLPQLGGVITALVIPSVASELLGVAVPVRQAATAEDAALAEHGITRTLGERTGPGMLSAESTAGKTAVAAGAMQRFLGARYQNIVNWANQLMDRMGQRTAQVSGWAGDARTAAAERANLLRQAKSAATGKMTEQATGVETATAEGISTEDAGEIVVRGIKGQLGALKQAASQAHEAVKEAAAGATSELEHTKPVLKALKNEQATAHALFRSPYPGTFLGGLQRGTEAIEAGERMAQQGNPVLNALSQSLEFGEDFSALRPDQQAIVLRMVQGEDLPPLATVPIETLKVARQGMGDLIGQLKRSNVHRGSYGRALRRGYGALSEDMEPAYRARGGQELVNAWRNADAMTKESYRTYYDQAFVRGFIRQMNPTAAEDVVTRLMQPGEASNFDAVVRALGNDARAKAVLGRGIIDQIRRSTERTSATIQGAAEQESRLVALQDALQKRPGIAKLIGDEKYNALRQSVKNLVSAEMRGAEGQAFLKSVAGNDGGIIAKNALENPDYANRLADLLKKNPAQKKGAGIQMVRYLLDKFTQDGPFGEEGARFDAAGFSRKYAQNRASISKMLSPDQVKGLDEFSAAMKRLPLGSRFAHAGQGFASQMYTFAAVGAAYKAAWDIMGGRYLAAAETIGMALTPRMLVELATRPTSARILAEALTMTPGAARINALAGKLAPEIAAIYGLKKAGTEGTTATGPNGHKIVLKGGSWVDAATGQPVQ